MDISQFLVDEELTALRGHFLVSGRGRPKKIPYSLSCTKRLLIQLKTVCDEGNGHYSDVFAWFCELFPDNRIEQSIFVKQVQRTFKKAQKIFAEKGEDDLKLFLNSSHEAFLIADELTVIGITSLELDDPTLFESVPSNSVLTNGAVLQLHNYMNRKKLTFSVMAMWLNHLLSASYSEDLLSSTLKKLVKEGKQRGKVKGRQPLDLQQFLTSPFLEKLGMSSPDNALNRPSQDKTIKSATSSSIEHSSASAKVIKALQKSLKDCQDEMANLNNKFQAITEQYQTASKTIVSLQAECAQLKKLTESLTEKSSTLAESVKSQEKVTKSQLYKSNSKLKIKYEKVLTMKSDLKYQVKSLTEKRKRLEADKLSLQKTKFFFKRMCVRLRKEKRSQKNPVITRDTSCNRFTDDVRMTIIGLQEAGISASKCSKVIGIVARNIYKEKLDDLPSISTSSNISDESHFLTKIHATERILQSSHVTLHTDGTSRQKQQYLGQQMTLSDGSLVSLGFSEVASEDSDTLLSATINLLEELSDVYCLVTDAEQRVIFKQLLERITSMMSDRAAVMQCYNRKFDSFRSTTLQTDTHTHFLYCNAHFLLGLSSSCEAALKHMEQDICSSGGTLGRDSLPRFKNWTSSSESATARLIRTTADVLGPRGDEKSGCRTEWLAFCNKDGLQSKITSYRSNRFNCLFENSLAIFQHRDHIQLFLSEFVTSSNLKLQSVLADISDAQIYSLLVAVGLLNTHITKPFWNLVNSTVQYVDFHQYVKRMVVNLESWIENPLLLLDIECRGAFNGEFSEEIDASLCAVAHQSPQLVSRCLSKALAKFLSVTKHQLHDFLEEGVFGREVDEETRAALKSCPLTNLSGEHAFGDLDFSMQTKRHASLHHRSTSNMLKRNHTTAWLEAKSATERHSVLGISTKHAKYLRQRHKQQEVLVKLHIQERIAENERLKKEKELHAAAEKRRILESVIKHGGPVKNKKDIKQVSVSGLEALKDQLRYIKVVLGVKKIKVSGSKAQLEAALCDYLLPGESSLDSSPPMKQQRIEGSDSEYSNSPGSCDEEEQPQTQMTFSYERQGQWVAVFYDSTYYIGQVIEISSPLIAVIKFLASTKGRKDYFRWPLSDDIAPVKSIFVFRWDFDVTPVSNDGRIWSVPEVSAIAEAYERIQSANL